MRHVICIRSAYTDAELSARRLEITREYLIPSLIWQRESGVEFDLMVSVSDDDPCLSARCHLFREVRVPVHWIEEPYWYSACWAYKTRLDDDDMLAPDFLLRLTTAISQIQTPQWYTFPEGYILKDGAVTRRKYTANQFVTRWCAPGESPYDVPHTEVKGAWAIDNKPAWVWVRHPDNITPEKDEHLGCYGEPRPVTTLADIFR